MTRHITTEKKLVLNKEAIEHQYTYMFLNVFLILFLA